MPFESFRDVRENKEGVAMPEVQCTCLMFCLNQRPSLIRESGQIPDRVICGLGVDGDSAAAGSAEP